MNLKATCLVNVVGSSSDRSHENKLMTIDSEGRFYVRGVVFRGEVLQRGCNEENQQYTSYNSYRLV